MFWKRLSYLLPWRRRAAERDMQEELRSIAAMAAPGELGNLTLAAEDARAEWGWARLEQTLQDVRYAWRTLRKAPGFTLAAVVSLAIGIGANTALFTLLNTVMWKRLPVQDPDRLLTIARQRSSDVTYGFTYQQYEIFRDHGALDLAAYGFARVDMAIDGRDEPAADVHLVTGRYFPLLGLRPAAGRLFDGGDDRAPMGHPVAVLSHAFWQRRFDGDRGVIGRTIVLGGASFTIVGVAPAGFSGVEIGVAPMLFVPVMMQPVVLPTNGSLLEQPDVYSTWLRLIGRLASGATLPEARARLDALGGGNPATEWRVREKFSGRFEDARLIVVSAATGSSDVRRQFSDPLFVLLGIAGLVLLIACANVGHLMLARSATRRAEFALRLALGAGRARIVRQVLVEGLVLASGGAVAGIALAYWAAPALVAYASAGRAPVVLNLSPDGRVLAFTTVISILAGLLFATVPAVRASRPGRFADVRPDLGRASVGGDRGPGKALVVAQIALSLVLLVAAGHFVRTLQNLYRQEPGIDLDRVVVVRLQPRGSGRRTAATAPILDRLYRDVLARVEALPGVRSASLARSSPLGASTLGFGVLPPEGGSPKNLSSTVVYPGYFATIGMPVLQGRDFVDADLEPGAPRAVIVNEAFVRDVLNGREPLGTGHGSLAAGRGRVRTEPLNIVGVVKDGRFPGLRDAAAPMVYQTFLQANTGFGQMVLHVRAARDARDIVAPITEIVRAIDRDTPLPAVQKLGDEVEAALARERLVAALAGVFSAVALALVCVGLYGLMAFAVARRTPEIGIRIALGATRSSVRRLVGRQVLAIVLPGLAIGVPAAWIAGRLASRQLAALLYDVTSTDATTMAIASGLLTIVAIVAGMLPARRATRIDPVVALRNE